MIGLNDTDLFPNHWNLIPIKDVVFFQEGPGVRATQYTDKGIKLLNGGNINNGTLTLETTNRYISIDEANGKYKHFLVDQGDLLIACSGVTVDKFDGKIAYAKKEHLPLCMNTSTMRFKPLDENVLYIDYFRRFLATNFFKKQLQKLITGSAQLNFGPSHINQMVMPLPSLEEQKCIATILDKADAIRHKRQQAIQLADQFLRSVFLEMFGDPATNPKGFPKGTIRDLVDTVTYGTSNKASTDLCSFPILRMGNITYGGGWDLSDLKYIDLTDTEQSKFLVSKGDLLFNRTNSKELVGKAAVFDLDLPMAYAGYLIRVRTNLNANNYYIAGYLNSKHGKQTLQSICKSIVGMANINAQELQNIEILIPPRALQDKYANIQISLKQKITNLLKSQEKLDNLFASLSYKVFSGTL